MKRPESVKDIVVLRRVGGSRYHTLVITIPRVILASCKFAERDRLVLTAADGKIEVTKA